VSVTTSPSANHVDPAAHQTRPVPPSAPVAISEPSARLLAVLGIAAIALIHILDAVGTFADSRYIFWLYMAIVIGAVPSRCCCTGRRRWRGSASLHWPPARFWAICSPAPLGCPATAPTSAIGSTPSGSPRCSSSPACSRWHSRGWRWRRGRGASPRCADGFRADCAPATDRAMSDASGAGSL